MLQKPTKKHDITDDLESLYWTILYTAIYRFKFTGEFDPRLFDEYFPHPDPVFGQIIVGGQTKRFWLTQPKVLFHCKALAKFLKVYGKFHTKFHTLVDGAKGGQAGAKKLDAFRKEIEKNVYSLLQFFDNVLDGPQADWRNKGVSDTKPERRTANAIERSRNHVREAAIYCSPWSDTEDVNVNNNEGQDDSEEEEVRQSLHGDASATTRGGKRSRKGPTGRRCRKKMATIAESDDEEHTGVVQTQEPVRRKPAGMVIGTKSDRVLRPRPVRRK